MLTMENVTALRMRRHCPTRRAGAAEYDALYLDLSPGLNVHWHGFGQPPCLVERADFDDVEYNGRRQRQRILVKGRFQNGNIGFVEAAQMELFAGLYRRPYKPTAHSELLRELIGREGPLNIEAMKRMTGLLVKQITPALHRNDPLVRCGESARKERYKSPEKGSEVTQYLLVDGVIRGAVMGHFRYGPYDLHAVWLELPEQEAAVRRDEILRAVYAVNGPREEPPPFVPVG